jgi:hypothetical protein
MQSYVNNLRVHVDPIYTLIIHVYIYFIENKYNVSRIYNNHWMYVAES